MSCWVHPGSCEAKTIAWVRRVLASIAQKRNCMNFGKPPIHPTDLASALAQQIGQTFDCPTNQAGFERLQRRKFTLTLQQTLQDLGEKRHMKVMYQKKGLPRDKTLRPQEKQHDKAEFLFDHVWLDSEDRICLAG